MKRAIVGINSGALVLLLVLFGVGVLFNDLDVQRNLTELDRTGCVDGDKFERSYGRWYRGIRDVSFAQHLADPWRSSARTAVFLGITTALANLIIALRDRKSTAKE